MVVRSRRVSIHEVPSVASSSGRSRSRTKRKPPSAQTRCISAKQPRLGDVVDDAVRDDRAEVRVGIAESLGVGLLDRDAVRPNPAGRTFRSRQREHVVGEVDRRDCNESHRSGPLGGPSSTLPAEFDGNLRRPVPTSRIGISVSQTARKSAAKTRFTSEWSIES